MDKKEIIFADKRKVFDSLLNYEDEYKELMDCRLNGGELCKLGDEGDTLANASYYGKERDLSLMPRALTEEDVDLEFMRIIFYRLL
jgi:hypothetical protein